MATASPRCRRGFEVIGTSESAPFAIIADEARKYLRACMFHPEVVHTPDGAKLLANFVHKIAGLEGDWTMPAYRAQRRRGDPQAGRQGQGHLRAFGRRRFLGRGPADPRGDRRPADLHPRRPRPDAQERGGRRRRHVPRALQPAAGPCRCVGPLHRRAGRRGRSGNQAQDHRPAVHRGVRGRGEEARRRRIPGAGHALSRRHRKRLLHRRPVGRRSSRTTMSAACRSA